MFDLDEIRNRATSDSYERGLQLFQYEQITRLSVEGHTVTATVLGGSDYQVVLTQGTPIANSCTCPAAEYQDVCKHCVAVALMVENTPAEELVGSLMTYIESDED